MPHIAFVPFRRCVHYSDYGFDYPKPTDIFTNCPHFTPIEANGKPALNGIGVIGLKDAHERALVPAGLVEYLMGCLGFLVGKEYFEKNKNQVNSLGFVGITKVFCSVSLIIIKLLFHKHKNG